MCHKVNWIILAAVVLVSTFGITRGANVFNMPDGQTSLEFVTVGDPGNAAGLGFHGAVGYTYQMGKYDVTTAQYCQFLNAVAKTSDSYGLYSNDMATVFPKYFGVNLGITRSGSAGSYIYSLMGDGNVPIFDVSWGDAARFCNWLQHGQPVGSEGTGTTETGAYMLNGATTNSALMAITRNATATYFIPSEDEWYKAAYYKGSGTSAGYWLYPTRNNTAPINVLSTTGTNNANFYDYDHTGNGGFTDPTSLLTTVGYFAASPGPYGTFDQGGDVWQWNESVSYDGSARGLRGGSLGDGSDFMASTSTYMGYPTYEDGSIGFRVASVPEPGSITLLLVSAVAGLLWWRLHV